VQLGIKPIVQQLHHHETNILTVSTDRRPRDASCGRNVVGGRLLGHQSNHTAV